MEYYRWSQSRYLQTPTILGVENWWRTEASSGVLEFSIWWHGLIPTYAMSSLVVVGNTVEMDRLDQGLRWERYKYDRGGLQIDQINARSSAFGVEPQLTDSVHFRQG